MWTQASTRQRPHDVFVSSGYECMEISTKHDIHNIIILLTLVITISHLL